jgi:formylglycine-generating enzyme required for sulfatase activity
VATQFFIHNLSWTTTSGRVAELLAECGVEATAVLVRYDPGTGRPRGFALVETNTDCDTDALSEALARVELDGRRLSVDVPTPEVFLRYSDIPPEGRRWRDYWETSRALTGNAALTEREPPTAARPPADDSTEESQTVGRYLISIEQDCEYVPWVVPNPGGARKQALRTVFTDLDVSVAQRVARHPATPGLRRTPFRLYFSQHRGRLLFIHGPFGSGKTTMLKALVLDLIEAWRRDGASSRIPVWLPLVQLRDDLQRIPLEHPESIWNHIRTDLTRRFARVYGDKVFNTLEEATIDRGVFLFDGLDDLPGSERTNFVTVAAKFAQQLSGSATVIVTGRPHVDDAYRKVPDAPVLSLPPLSPDLARDLFNNWTDALDASSTGDSSFPHAHHESAAAIVEDETFEPLTQRPIYLAALAAMEPEEQSRIESPSDLYEAIVKLYFSQWEEHPALLRPLSAHMPAIRDALEHLAYDCLRQPVIEAEPEHHGLIDPVLVWGRLSAVLPEDISATSVSRVLDERLGIISSMSGGYTFPHKSIMEYLAACHIASEPDALALLAELLDSDPLSYREVFAFYFGRRARTDSVGAGECIAGILADIDNHGGDVDAEIALAKSLRVLASDDALPPPSGIRPYAERLCGYLERDIPVTARVDIGNTLACTDDVRPGVVQLEEDGLPSIVWRRVPATPFTAGTSDESSDWADRTELGLPQPIRVTNDFLMARYPITVAQFRPFIELGGFEDPQFWTEDGLQWLAGAWSSKWSKTSDWLHEHLGAAMSERLPLTWEKQLRHPNRPVVCVSWFEALAYTRWLTEQCRLSDLQTPMDGVVVRLPFELEWEAAARSDDGRQWPWGDGWRDFGANTHEAGIGQLCAVGLFPMSDSVYGIADMCGNCWEWTASRFTPYAEQQLDVEIAETIESVTVRGGSWCHDRFSARCAFRDWNVPGDRSDTVGFRPVIATVASHVDVWRRTV